MSRLLLKGGHLVDPSQSLDQVGDVLLVDGKIEAVGPRLELDGDGETVDCKNLVVAPGFIDGNARFGQPGFEYREDIRSGTRAAAKGGFTSVAVMPNTNPVNDQRVVTEYLLRTAAEQGVVHVLPIGAVSQGTNGEQLAEIGEMAQAGIVAISEGKHSVGNAQLLRRAMEYAGPFGLPLIEVCEDASLANKGTIHEGAVSARLGLYGIPDLAEALPVQRGIQMAEWLGHPIHFTQLSAQRSVEILAKARAGGIRASADVSPAHLLFTEQQVLSFDPSFKSRPPLRSERDRQALIAAIRDGVVTMCASGHLPASVVEKDREFEDALVGAISLEAAVSVYLEVLHHREGMTLGKIVALCANAPAALFGLKDRGSLVGGSRGDITILDPKVSYTFAESDLRSKSRNCPFVGQTLRGRAVMTIVDGKVVWREGSF